MGQLIRRKSPFVPGRPSLGNGSRPGSRNAILPSSLCADPMLPLAGTLAIFQATLDSPFIAPKDKA